MKALDLYCGAGGTSDGLARAGFKVTGVDSNPKCAKHYPYEFIAADVLSLDPSWIAEFDLVFSGPPCQFASLLKHRTGKQYYNFIPETRELLLKSGKSFVIENVEAAKPHLNNPITLCGSMFGLGAVCKDGQYRQLRRHRVFEANFAMDTSKLKCNHQGQPVGVYGGGSGSIRGYKAHAEEGRVAMGLDHFMPRAFNSQAIPPAYSKWIAEQWLNRSVSV